MFPKTLTAFLGLLLFTTSPTYAGNSYQVGGVMTGQAYNDILKEWTEQTFVMAVTLDEGQKERLYFVADTGLGNAQVGIDYSKAVKQKLESSILKALKWSEVARKHKADTSKPIGCLADPWFITGFCKEHGQATRGGQIGLKFFSANGGKQTDLIISIVDSGNQFTETTLYLNPPRMKKFLANIRKIDHTFKKAHDTERKQDLFN